MRRLHLVTLERMGRKCMRHPQQEPGECVIMILKMHLHSPVSTSAMYKICKWYTLCFHSQDPWNLVPTVISAIIILWLINLSEKSSRVKLGELG